MELKELNESVHKLIFSSFEAFILKRYYSDVLTLEELSKLSGLTLMQIKNGMARLNFPLRKIDK